MSYQKFSVGQLVIVREGVYVSELPPYGFTFLHVYPKSFSLFNLQFGWHASWEMLEIGWDDGWHFSLLGLISVAWGASDGYWYVDLLPVLESPWYWSSLTRKWERL